jgi:hypothetical protein
VPRAARSKPPRTAAAKRAESEASSQFPRADENSTPIMQKPKSEPPVKHWAWESEPKDIRDSLHDEPSATSRASPRIARTEFYCGTAPPPGPRCEIGRPRWTVPPSARSFGARGWSGGDGCGEDWKGDTKAARSASEQAELWHGLSGCRRGCCVCHLPSHGPDPVGRSGSPGLAFPTFAPVGAWERPDAGGVDLRSHQLALVATNCRPFGPEAERSGACKGSVNANRPR